MSSVDIGNGNLQVTSSYLRVAPEIEMLQCEILRHPKLLTDMRLADARGEVNTFEDGIAIVAAYVDVTLHGMYGANEIGALAAMLVRKLKVKRGEV